MAVSGVPFVDLKRNYLSIKEEIDSAVSETINSTSFILGKGVEDFEKNFAAYLGTAHAVGVNSGTSALTLSLLALGIGKGDEVITAANTFFATAEAISLAGATPVFADVNEKTLTIDSEKVKEKVSRKTKAVVPVHFYGQPADMKPILELSEKHSLKVVEDACQAHGSEYRGKKCGSMGNAGCFSFYPAKNLGAFGEAGMVVCRDEAVKEKVALLRGHGENPKNSHAVIGYNNRMEGLQGAVLNAKLPHLDEWNEKRRKNAALYNELLSGSDLAAPTEADYAKHIYHLYVVKTENRDSLRERLGKEGVATGIHYPVPIHLQKAYSFLGYGEGSFPVSEEAAKKILSLPMFPELTEEEIEFVCGKLGARK